MRLAKLLAIAALIVPLCGCPLGLVGTVFQGLSLGVGGVVAYNVIKKDRPIVYTKDCTIMRKIHPSTASRYGLLVGDTVQAGFDDKTKAEEQATLTPGAQVIDLGSFTVRWRRGEKLQALNNNDLYECYCGEQGKAECKAAQEAAEQPSP